MGCWHLRTRDSLQRHGIWASHWELMLSIHSSYRNHTWLGNTTLPVVIFSSGNGTVPILFGTCIYLFSNPSLRTPWLYWKFPSRTRVMATVESQEPRGSGFRYFQLSLFCWYIYILLYMPFWFRCVSSEKLKPWLPPTDTCIHMVLLPTESLAPDVGTGRANTIACACEMHSWFSLLAVYFSSRQVAPLLLVELRRMA